ncbi:cytochrome b [Sphingomonas montana]|uniref:cytochrome b n=1 Tax=Sphingomonas montana TaxID=1843236 RepID=UPI00096C8C36|nr:cytochrome b [Sphingomonas montana]
MRRPIDSAHVDGGRRYSRVAIAFHWTIALLVIVNLGIGLLHEQLEGIQLIPVHKSIGITVLFLSIARLAWRLTHPAPALPADVPGWQRAVSGITHMALYALMILMPLTGWWFASAAVKKYPLDWFGLFPIPYLPVTRGGDLTHSAHEVLGWTMLALVALHVAAALKHHFIDRDTVLLRIMPAGSGR